jgi:hypothetical protein
MVEKTKTVRGGKWTEDPPIHFGWLAAALLPSRTSGEGSSSARPQLWSSNENISRKFES